MFIVPKPARRGPRLRVHAGRRRQDRGPRHRHDRLPRHALLRGRASMAGACPAPTSIGGEAGLGRGFYLQMEGFENGRLQTAARAVGVMQAAYEAALDYAANRVVFGSPIVDYQLTRAKLGAHGGHHPGGPPDHVRGRPADGQGRGRARGVDGEGLRVPGRRVGHPRGAADPRRHGLRRGVRRQPSVRRRPRPVDLRRRGRDLGLKVIARRLIESASK